MAFDFATTKVSYILGGIEDTFKLTAGAATSNKFLYGTVQLTNSDFGIIVSANVKSAGDISQIKGACGAALAKAIMNPGFAGTLSILYPVECALPVEFTALTLTIPSTTGGATQNRVFMIDSFSVKWEREGWRMIDLEVDSPDSILGGSHNYVAARIKADGSVSAVIDLDS